MSVIKKFKDRNEVTPIDISIDVVTIQWVISIKFHLHLDTYRPTGCNCNLPYKEGTGHIFNLNILMEASCFVKPSGFFLYSWLSRIVCRLQNLSFNNGDKIYVAFAICILTIMQKSFAPILSLLASHFWLKTPKSNQTKPWFVFLIKMYTPIVFKDNIKRIGLKYKNSNYNTCKRFV